MTGRKDQDEEKTDESRSLPVDQDFGPQDAQLPFQDGPGRHRRISKRGKRRRIRGR